MSSSAPCSSSGDSAERRILKFDEIRARPEPRPTIKKGPWLQAGRPFFAALLCACFSFAGCLSRPALVKQSFEFSAPSGPERVATKGPVLGIRRLVISAPFDTQSFVYRTGEFSYEKDPYAEFLATPAETLAETLRADFRRTGVFAAVNEPGSARQPDLLAEITVTRLYGDFRPGPRPAAVLGMLVVFFNAQNGAPTGVRFEKDYLLQVPVKRRTAADLIAGWNEALEKIVASAARDLTTH